MHKSTVHRKGGLFLAAVLAVAACLAHLGATAEDLSDMEARLAAADLDHGRKLYENTCDSCHTTTPHWRDKRLVDSWTGLLQQVDRWQRNSGQRWDPADINDVAAYLNARFYKLPCPPDKCTGTQASVRSKDAGIN